MDYQKLTEDLKVSDELATKSIEGKSDGGTANLDSVFLKLPRCRESKVVEAIKSAGLYCSGKVDWSYFGKGYMITPTKVGQGDTRYLAVQTMYEKLKELDYDVQIFYMMD